MAKPLKNQKRRENLLKNQTYRTKKDKSGTFNLESSY